MTKLNVIIDTDPGVDDIVAIIPALFDQRLNILLFTTVSGNIDIDQSTKNMLHVLEVCHKNIPVAKGAEKPLFRAAKDAKFIHGEDGSGKYVIKSEPKTKPIEKDAVEAMYETICAHKNDITILLLGPHTNMAQLLIKHPDVKDMITHVVSMGTSNYGHKKITPIVRKKYISFNASSDPEALNITLNSGLPITLIPSEIGRASHLSEAQVREIKKTKIVGNMLYDMLNGYWEPGVKEKVVAMNDTCAVLNLTHPEIFERKKANIYVNTSKKPGKTVYKFRKDGKVDIVTNVDLDQFYNIFFTILRKIN